MIENLVALVMLVVVGGGIAWVLRSGVLNNMGALGGNPAAIAQALTDLYSQRLGYVTVSAPDPRQAVAAGQPARTHMVRRLPEGEIHYESSTEYLGTSTRVSCAWTARVGRPMRVAFQVVNASLAGGAAGAAGDFVMGRSRAFQPAFPQRIASGDAAFDARYALFAPDAGAALAVVMAPEVRSLLDALPVVNVRTTADSVVLDDPFQEMLLGLMGGPMGMAQIATPQGLERQAFLHDTVAQLLLRVSARAG